MSVQSPLWIKEARIVPQKDSEDGQSRSQGKGEGGASAVGVKAKRMAIEHKRRKLTFGQTEREREKVKESKGKAAAAAAENRGRSACPPIARGGRRPARVSDEFQAATEAELNRDRSSQCGFLNKYDFVPLQHSRLKKERNMKYISKFPHFLCFNALFLLPPSLPPLSHLLPIPFSRSKRPSCPRRDDKQTGRHRQTDRQTDSKCKVDDLAVGT